jgi:hypothetical protein
MRWNRSIPVFTSGIVILIFLCFQSPEPEDPTAADESTLHAAQVNTDDPALLEFFRARTLTPQAQAEIDKLVGQLGARSYRVRQKASARLVARGSAAVSALREATSSTDLEVARRAQDALKKIRRKQTGPTVTAAAVRVLTARKPEGAATTLLAFLPFAENDYVAGEVHDALAGLARIQGRPVKALVAGLAETDQVKRAAAAEALCRAGVRSALPAVRKLLRDPEPAVRLRAAMGLATARDKDAVPVLIELLDHLPRGQAAVALDFLYQIGEDQSPYLPLGADGDQRRQCRDAWAAWWRKHADKADLAKLSEKRRLRGYTMLVLLDEGKVLERDATGKLRWEIGGLDLPTDVQHLPGERLLITEHGGGRVSERTVKGKVLWEKKFTQPLMAQRLPNGNTFVATRTELVEMDPAGKRVFTFSPPGHDLFMRACKLPGGDVAFVSMSEQLANCRFHRIDAGGKTLTSFPVNVSTFGGRIQVLPDGRVLIPEMAYNRVSEYDSQGRVVWSLRVRQPVVAVRLPGGNTLVTTFQERRAIEFDKAGQEVAEFKADSRVTRAWRR